MAQPSETSWNRPLQPWDDGEMAKDLLDLVVTLPRHPLPEVATNGPTLPGGYLHWVSSDHPDVVGLLGPTARAEIPAYAGLASRNLRARQSRYRQSLTGMRAISENDIHVTVIPCATTASAAFAEMVLLEAYRPVLNALGGWGAKVPGARRNPRVSLVDALWPGRGWTHEADPLRRVQAMLTVVANRAERDPAGPRWEPIEPRRSLSLA